MRHPENGRGPEPKPEASAAVTSNDSTAAILLTPVSTRTCGSECWCHTGSSISWPYPHEAFLGEMFRQIRILEISQGVPR